MNMKKNGFTLIELIIGLGIAVIIMVAVYAAMNTVQRSSSSVVQKVTTQQDVRTVLDIMAMEIRMASYNPQPPVIGSTWSSIPACSTMGNITPTTGSKGIQVANASTILIAMDLNGDGVIGCNANATNCKTCCGPPNTCTDTNCAGSNEYIEYSYGTNTIHRNVNCSGDTDILGGTDNATTVINGTCTSYINGTCACTSNINGTCPALFQYFDASGASLADGTGTVPATSIPNIRRIRITIVAQTLNTDSLTRKFRTMTYSTDVLVKNHAWN